MGYVFVLIMTIGGFATLLLLVLNYKRKSRKA
jgi:hypothetical protein